MKNFKPSVPITEFPVRDTHPKTSGDLLAQELEDDPDFWDRMAQADDSTSDREQGDDAVQIKDRPGMCIP